MLISKSDLIEIIGDFDPERAVSCLRQLANPAEVFVLSSRSGSGIEAWCDWIKDELICHRRRLGSGDSERPRKQQEPNEEIAHVHAGGERQ